MSEQTYRYDGTEWLVSLFRALREYLEGQIDLAFMRGPEPVGLDAYEIVFDYPDAVLPAEKWPLKKNGKAVTLIHFSIDDIENTPLGIGENTYAETVVASAPDLAGEVVPEEAERHVVNFDVGVWATDESGGPTSRLLAYQTLNQLLSGPRFQEFFQERTGGLEALSFTGGRFVVENINDIRTYRIIGCEFSVRVFSRNIEIPSVLVDVVDQVPELMIGEDVIVDWQ